MKWLLVRMTAVDRLVTGLLLLVSIAGLAWLATAPRGQQVTVSDGERILFVAPLNQSRTVDLPGPLGLTTLEIGPEGARIVASPCTLKLCMGMGPAHRPGDLLACLPNRILVQIEGEMAGNEKYDLLSR